VTLEIKSLSGAEWRHFAHTAQVLAFRQTRDPSMDRIDFALLAVKNGEPCGFVTVRELDSESIYWQFGGAFPQIKATVHVQTVYREFVKACAGKYRRVTTLVENDNVPYLRLAMAAGFRIIGVRVYGGTVLVELHMELSHALQVEGASALHARSAPGHRREVGREVRDAQELA
jgi:RimJ/RimL family protein N-acetyltransferase